MITVTVLNRQRGHRVSGRALSTFLRDVARRVSAGEDGELAVCLVSDRKMVEFNRRFRGRDVTTDVLSFPAGENPSPEASDYLGDIVISVPRASEQAAREGHSLARELKILALHAYLHLIGHDHEMDGGRMNRLQARLVRQLLPISRGRKPA